MLNENRLFPVDPETRAIARALFATVEKLPLVCPHGHTNPAWFSRNEAFENPAQLLIVPDHYLVRMLVSQGVNPASLGVPTKNGDWYETDGRAIWRLFAKHYYLFRSTPSRLWFDHALQFLFGIKAQLSAETADAQYDHIADCLTQDSFRPRALFDQFNIEVLATTDSCTDTLSEHRAIGDDAWAGRVIPTYRPDAAVDPDHVDFFASLRLLGELTNEDVSRWSGYLAAHKNRRAYFKTFGATATDHGHPSAFTADLSSAKAESLFQKVVGGESTAADRELFRGQMLTEMAAMSIDDGLVMQIHPGSFRNHSDGIFSKFGADNGFDIPKPLSYVSDLRPLLNKFGLNSSLSIVLFTLDESVYSRELAPLAGAYPCLKLGPPWWFQDSPAGMTRFRELVTETAGFYNTAGFNDDTRAFPTIPARHDVARRIDCAFLAKQVAEHIISEEEAYQVALDLSGNLARAAYKF